MEYNDLYKFRNENHGNLPSMTLVITHCTQCICVSTVVVGNQRTFVKFEKNPSYDSMCTIHVQKDRGEEEVARSANRRQLEHTYESLSNFHVHATSP